MSAPGCGKKPYVSTLATVERDAVHVHVMASPGAEVQVGHQKRTLAGDEDDFYLALDPFKPGRNELKVTVTQGGATAEESAAFTAPEGAGAPFLQIHDCARLPDGTSSTDVRSRFGRANGCKARKDAPHTLVASANPGAKVKVGGKEMTAGPDGEITLELDAAAGLLDMQVGASKAQRSEIPFSVEVRAGAGEPLRGDIRLSADGDALLRSWLKGFTPGKPLAAGVGAGEGAIAIYAPQEGRPRIVGGPGPLRDVRLVAIGKERPLREAGSCGPYESDKGGVFSAPRRDHDVDITVYDATTGEKREEKGFSAKGTECPAYASMVDFKVRAVDVYPEDADIAAWLRTLLPTR